MPRITKPSDIKTGSGKTAPSVTDNLVLTGLTPPAAPPNIGSTGYVVPGLTLAQAHPGIPAPAGTGCGGTGDGGLLAHVNDPVAAHMASAIGLDEPAGELFSSNVQGAINELVSGVAAKPPMLGQSFSYMTFSGIPDWGAAKLSEWPIIDEGKAGKHFVYPYYWAPSTPTLDWLTPNAPSSTSNAAYTEYYRGIDPSSDMLWNGLNIAGFDDIPGTGLGHARTGAFTGSDNSVKRTRGFPVQYDGGGSYVIPVTVSGSIFPADRGVLALIHWPASNDKAGFLAQDVLDRCVAALVLGAGSDGSGGGATGNCITVGAPPPVNCDGNSGSGPTSGSIFSVGLNSAGYYDPFQYPGQASGQYDLHEINTGISDIDGTTPLAAPWDAGWTRDHNSILRGAGQVRLGTDATLDPTGVKPYGIPVLGAGPAAYTAPAVTDPIDILTNTGPVTYNKLGQTLLLDSNFFRYRLPYLKDYTKDTGLPYTPRGVDPHTTRESARYFNPGPDNLYDSTTAYFYNRINHDGPPEWLVYAGNYDNFQEDCWNWQVARYRHSFYIPGSTTPGVNLGTYWMIHFKTEANFEAFVRDGIMPWDAPYEVYGATLLDTAADNVASTKNLVNPLAPLAAAPFGAPFAPGKGPAPDYGWSSRSYHVLRSSIVTGDSTIIPTAVTKTFTWEIPSPEVMYVSGVAYFLPVDAAGNEAFKITNLDVDITHAWDDFYRVDDNGLTGTAPQLPPARLSSPCPAFLGVAPFAFEATPSYTIDTAVMGDLAARAQRIEVPFDKLGPFSDVVGPTAADHLVLSAGTGITFQGDVSEPAFSTDASLVAFIRRPLTFWVIQPQDYVQGGGFRLTPQTTAGAKSGDSILFHSTRWNVANPTAGHYGNFVPAGAPPQPIYAALTTSLKDTEERFLDETYRYDNTFVPIGSVDIKKALVGSGMQGWTFGPIPTPTQIGVYATTWTGPFGWTADWGQASFVQNPYFQTSLGTLTTELQVAGLPYRNPFFGGSANEGPFPSAGLLLYPQTNYSTGFVPDNTVAGGSLGSPQPDYSGLPALADTRSFVRVFDTAFSRDTDLYVDTSGQPFVVLHIEGLGLDDFKYVAPGPGNTVSGISIMVKVPGLTTWMDVGRPDGDGPSKQDPALDGAGCAVIGPNTFDVTPLSLGITTSTYSQVRVNVGPFVNLARGVQAVAGPPIRYEVPLMVKVTMTPDAVGYNLKQPYVSPGVFSGVDTPGAALQDLRGLYGIKVVHPTLVQSH